MTTHPSQQQPESDPLTTAQEWLNGLETELAGIRTSPNPDWQYRAALLRVIGAAAHALIAVAGELRIGNQPVVEVKVLDETAGARHVAQLCNPGALAPAGQPDALTVTCLTHGPIGTVHAGRDERRASERLFEAHAAEQAAGWGG